MMNQINYKEIIQNLYLSLKEIHGKGKVADYIPALAKINTKKFGISFAPLDADPILLGDYRESFSIQSISKVFTLSMALGKLDHKLWKRLGVEPSGTSFNSLIQLEEEEGIPRNPFINAGAIVISDIILSNYSKPYDKYIRFIRQLSGSNDIDYDNTIYQSEKEFGEKNRAMAHFLKSYNNLKNNVEDVLDFYFMQCSVKMTCEQLSRSFLYLANHGLNPHDTKCILSKSQTKRLNAIMLTCGFYDESGDFAYKVGLPGKSGVGGGIAAILPQQYSIAVWSPALGPKGNSEKGMKFLESFTTETNQSVF